MKWEDCKKCPESVCYTGIYDVVIDPKTGSVDCYRRGSILKTTEVSIRPICLLYTSFRIDPAKGKPDYVYPFLVNHSTLLKAITYTIDKSDLSLESLLYYMKIKSEVEDYEKQSTYITI